MDNVRNANPKIFWFLSISLPFLILLLCYYISIAPIFIAIFSLIPIFFILVCLKFRLAVLVMLIFATGFVPGFLTPTIPVLGGTIKAEDMFLCMLIVVGMLRLTLKIDTLQKDTFWYPLLFFAILVVFSLLIALEYNNKLRYIIFELRRQIYWFYAPLIVMCIKGKEELDNTINFIIFLATLLAVMICIQSFTGLQLINNSSVQPLVTLNAVNYDVTRSRFGGFQLLVVFALSITLARVARNEISWKLSMIILLPIILGLIVSFGRSVWAVSIVVIFITSAWLGLRYFIKILSTLFLAAGMIVSTSALVKPELLTAIVDRTESVDREIASGSSWDWRIIEKESALEVIKKRPIQGIGLGGEYLNGMTKYVDETQKIAAHNSYLWFALKFGVLGLLFPLWLLLAVLRRASQLGTSLSIACGAAFFNPILVGFTQMEWTTAAGILCMATIFGLLAAHSHMTK
jgi:O-antigen ligase